MPNASSSRPGGTTPTAGLPGIRAIVHVGPPLSARPAALNPAGVSGKQRAARRPELPSSSRLYPWSMTGPVRRVVAGAAQRENRCVQRVGRASSVVEGAAAARGVVGQRAAGDVHRRADVGRPFVANSPASTVGGRAAGVLGSVSGERRVRQAEARKVVDRAAGRRRRPGAVGVVAGKRRSRSRLARSPG